MLPASKTSAPRGLQSSPRLVLPILVCLTGLQLLWGTATVSAQTSYPMLMSLKPSAAQVGATSEHELASRYSMFGFDQVLVTGTGVQGEIITPMELGADGKTPSLTKIKLRFTVAEDAPEGVRDFRIIGPTGASTLGQLVITRNPVSYETANNDTRDKATAVTLPATICGAVEKAEDVDLFRFTVDAPKTLTFHVWGMRLQDKIHDLQTHVDPIITLRNASGSTIGASDNVYAADPFLVHAFQEPGDYFLEVRDVRFQGNPFWEYVIEVSEQPYVSTIHPLAAQQNQTGDFLLIGENLGEQDSLSWGPQTELNPGIQVVQLPLAAGRSNPVLIYVDEHPVLVEQTIRTEVGAELQELTIPGGIAGQLEEVAEIDRYRFQAKKGDRLTFEVLARRLNSSLDSILTISDSNGKVLTENDDLRLWGKRTYQDSMIENWAVPADGEYVVAIRDVHLRGGVGYPYYLRATHAEPDFELVLDSDKTILTAGTRGAAFVRVVRKNGFSGEVELQVENLPAGVTANCGRIPANGNDGCIVFESTGDGTRAVSNVIVRGIGRVGEGEEARELLVTAQSMQETYMPGGGRNHWPVEMHSVVVAEEADLLKMEVDQTEIRLAPGGTAKIAVTIERAEGFDKNVTLDLLYQHLSSRFADTLPKGVTIDGRQSKTLLNGKETTAEITLVATKDAPAIEKQQCVVMANVSINFVMKATYASQPVLITVTE